MRRLRGVGASAGLARGHWIRVDGGDVPVGGRVAPEGAETTKSNAPVTNLSRVTAL